MAKSFLQNKVVWAVGGLVVLAAVVGGVVWARGGSAGPSTPTPKPTLPPEPVNVIPVEERPYARLLPSTDGRTVTVSLEKLNKDADDGQYEIEYQSGTVLQGAGGRLDLSDLPDQEDILLGSCSAGGKCSYHEDVTGGSLTLRLEGAERYAVRGEWSFLDADKRDQVLASRDGKLGITGTRARYGIVFQSPGYPDALPGRAISSIYAVAVTPEASGTFTVSLRLNEDVAAANLAVWDGTNWDVVEGEVVDKMLTVSLSELPQALIAVVAQE